MCRIDGEAAECYSVTRRTARKEHKCGECRRTILAGEPYDYHSFVYEGEGGNHSVCTHCAVLTEWIVRECGGTVTGELIEDIEEHAKEYERGDLGNLAACARAHWMKGPSFRKPYPGIRVPKLPPPLASADPTSPDQTSP
jgi:hypothetical protein